MDDGELRSSTFHLPSSLFALLIITFLHQLVDEACIDERCGVGRCRFGSIFFDRFESRFDRFHPRPRDSLPQRPRLPLPGNAEASVRADRLSAARHAAANAQRTRPKATQPPSDHSTPFRPRPIPRFPPQSGPIARHTIDPVRNAGYCRVRAISSDLIAVASVSRPRTAPLPDGPTRPRGWEGRGRGSFRWG